MIILRNKFFSTEKKTDDDDRFHTGRNTAIVSGVGALGTGATGLILHNKYKNKYTDYNNIKEAVAGVDKKIDTAYKDNRNLKNTFNEIDTQRTKLSDKIGSLSERIKDEEKHINDKRSLIAKLEEEAKTAKGEDLDRINKLIEGHKDSINNRSIENSSRSKAIEDIKKQFEGISGEFDRQKSYLDKSDKYIKELENFRNEAQSKIVPLGKEVDRVKKLRNRSLWWGAGITGAAGLGTYLYGRYKNRDK